MKQVRIIEDQEAWHGSYVVDGRNVCVSSAYGSDRAPLARKDDPDKIAQGLLRGLVQRWEPASRRLDRPKTR